VSQNASSATPRKISCPRTRTRRRRTSFIRADRARVAAASDLSRQCAREVSPSWNSWARPRSVAAKQVRELPHGARSSPSRRSRVVTATRRTGRQPSRLNI
jgi:hypothetical protein